MGGLYVCREIAKRFFASFQRQAECMHVKPRRTREELVTPLLNPAMLIKKYANAACTERQRKCKQRLEGYAASSLCQVAAGQM